MGVKSPFFRAWCGDWKKYDASKVRVIKPAQGAAISSVKAVNANTAWSRSQLIGETHSHNSDDKVSKEALNSIDEIVKNVY